MRRARFRRALAAGGAATALALSVAGLAGADRGQDPGGAAEALDGLVVQDVLHGTTPQQMAESLLRGVAISNVVYRGAPNAAGRFEDTGPGSVVGFNSGIVMGSGSVQTTATSTSCTKGVEGPNQCDTNGTVNAFPGDADLTALAGYPTHDAAVLEFDFVPDFSTVQFRYVFSSDEYNEYANTTDNDTFAFFIDGVNCALVPGTAAPVSVDTINGGNPYGTNAQNPAYFINNDLQDRGGTVNTEMDGLTTVLTCNAAVNANATNHLKVAIADASDSLLDSNAFIEGGRFVSGTQVTTTQTGGGRSGASITVPSGMTVVDQATLQGVHAATATGTVTYTVYSDAGCTTAFASGGTKTVAAGTVPPSDPVTFSSPGLYYWVAAYSGDADNNASASACGAEVTTVEGPGPPATLVLSPKTATNPAGTEHCVTAAVADQTGTPTPGVDVTFSVGGANTVGATVRTTDANGRATFCYTGTSAGTDTIAARASGGTSPSDTATKEYAAGAPAALTLTPPTATNTAGQQHCVTATVTDAYGNPVPLTPVDFSVAGANAQPATTLATDANGKATYCYTGTRAGTDTITARAQLGTQPSATATKTYTADRPAKLMLAPPAATNPVGSQHCVTATVTDRFDNPVAGVAVTFTVTGTNAASGTRVTDANGQATFCYSGSLPGGDTIKATASGGTNPSGTASKTWTVPASACGDVEGEGSIRTALGKGTFELEASLNSDGGVDGHVGYTDKGAKTTIRFESRSIDSLVIVDSSSATIFGTGRVNKGPVQPFRVDVTHSKSGDTFSIAWAGYAAGGKVMDGKIKIKAKNCKQDDHGQGGDDGGGKDNGGGRRRG